MGLRVLQVDSTESLAVGSSCKVAPESWGIEGSKVVSSKGLEGYECSTLRIQEEKIERRRMLRQ